MSKVWFITGASKGFGREWAEAALERGDRVEPEQGGRHGLVADRDRDERQDRAADDEWGG